jgi:hypothetical protein
MRSKSIIMLIKNNNSVQFYYHILYKYTNRITSTDVRSMQVGSLFNFNKFLTQYTVVKIHYM